MYLNILIKNIYTLNNYFLENEYNGSKILDNIKRKQ